MKTDKPVAQGTNFTRKNSSQLHENASALITPAEAIAAGKRARQALEQFIGSVRSMPASVEDLDKMEVDLIGVAETYLRAKSAYERVVPIDIRDQLVPLHVLAEQLITAIESLTGPAIAALADQRNFKLKFPAGQYDSNSLHAELQEFSKRCRCVIEPDQKLLEERPYLSVRKGPRPRTYVAKAVARLCSLASEVLKTPFVKTLDVANRRDEFFVQTPPEFVRIALTAVDDSIKFGTVRSALQNYVKQSPEKK